MADLLNDETEELDEEESEWQRVRRDKEEMTQRFDKLFSLFPDKISFHLSCDRHWDIFRPHGTKSVRISSTNSDFRSSHIVSGTVMIRHNWNKPMDIEIIDFSKQDYDGAITEISDEDAKGLIITAVKAVIKADAHEHVEVKKNGLSRIYSCNGGAEVNVEEVENSGYYLTFPVIEIKHGDTRRFEWLED